MVLGDEHSKTNKLKINCATIYSQNSVKLLGVTIDKRLNFNCHVENICKTASYKLFALQRIRKYISTEQAKTLAFAFINRNQDRKLKIENIHKRRVVFREYDKSYEDLLTDHNLTTIHRTHLQYLATEVFKSVHKLNPEFMTEFFSEKDSRCLRRTGNKVEIPSAITSKYEINSIHFRGAMLWNTLPNTLKECRSLSIFKTNIKKMRLSCNCVACRP